MATVNKDFRVKAGLVVEGANATVNGENILTTGSSTSDLTEGTNLYFTNQRALDATSSAYDAAGAAATAQSNAEDYADGLAANYDPAGAATTAENNAKSYADSLATNYEPAGSITTAINALDTDDIDEGITNLYFTDARAESAIDGATISSLTVDTSLTISSLYDGGNKIYSSATKQFGDGGGNSIFYGSFEGNVTGQVSDLSNHDTDDLTEGATNLYFTNQRALDATSAAYDPAGAASTALADAQDYADGLAGNYDAAGAAATAEANANSYTDTAVSGLVDSAPDLLNTLNELAAAIGDDANFATTITTSLGGKVEKAGDTMTGALTLSGAPTSDLHAATKKYVDDAVAGATDFTEIVLPGANISALFTTAGTSGTTVDTWSTSEYSTAKYLLQMKSGSDIHVLEAIVTVDGSGNVYVTAYAEVISNASLGTIDASHNAGTVSLIVTAVNASTEIKISKTYLEA
jgi:hypothetical protein